MRVTIRILIAEDTDSPHDSLTNIINGQADMLVVGTANRAKAIGLCRCKKLAPDLALIAAAEEEKACIAAPSTITAARIRRELPDMKVMIIAAAYEESFIHAAQIAGVHSVIRRDCGGGDLLYAIRFTMNGHGVYPGPAS